MEMIAVTFIVALAGALMLQAGLILAARNFARIRKNNKRLKATVERCINVKGSF